MGQKSSELMGVRSQNRKITFRRLDEDEKLAELISVTKRQKPLRWWLSAGAWGCYSVFIRQGCRFDKRLDVTSVISSAVPF